MTSSRPSDGVIAAARPLIEDAARPTAETTAYVRVEDGATFTRSAAIAAETPIALVYNGVSHVVMMATPADLEDFAVGFSLSEGVIADPGELIDLETEESAAGVQVAATITARRFAELAERRRNLAGRTGCGICGVESLGQVVRPLPRLDTGPQIGIAAIRRALAALPARQPLARETGATHAAAWADTSGSILLVREDVGRHNALDKLIGAMARGRVDPRAGFAIITSRCSFEMVQKAATVGIAVIVAISAPTTMALEIAERAGVTLVAFARADGVGVYANPGRIEGI